MGNAILALEDGLLLYGSHFGAEGEARGEVVFNTSMTGYQEIITDPSYKGQIVTMTYPLIGNYGINPEDIESFSVHLEGFVVKEKSALSSNWRAKETLEEYLKRYNKIGIEGIDTRHLTKHLRTHGAKKGIISTIEKDANVLVRKAKEGPDLVGRDLAKEVTSPLAFEWNAEGQTKYRVVLIDCGVKHSILRLLAQAGCHVYIVPAHTSVEEIVSYKPDGLVLSNGPGDPEAVTGVIKTVQRLHDTLPIFGICLGHQILGLALGAKTFKLKFGHHGANHPVMDLMTKKVEITSQNHGFSIDPKTLNTKDVEITHINLYDKTIEGIAHKTLPLFSVQFHPEAGPGPHDSYYLFHRFVASMGKGEI